MSTNITDYNILSVDNLLNIFWMFFALVVYICQMVGWWHIFKKANEKPWKALVPFYNYYTQIKISWKLKYFWILVGVIVFTWLCKFVISFNIIFIDTIFIFLGIAANILFFFLFLIAQYKLSKSFGHNILFSIGLILVPYVFILILGLGSSEYVLDKN